MKRPTILLEAMLIEDGIALGVPTARDVLTLRHRVKHEGLSFITITLPTLSDFLEQGLESGRLALELSRSFRFCTNRRLPRFLGGFFSLVFDDDGYLKHNASIDAIKCIRQISRSFKKLFLVCDEARSKAASQRYVQIEKELSDDYERIVRIDPYLDDTCALIGKYFCIMPEEETERPNHGPGVTADSLSPNGRWSIRNWNVRSESAFPLDWYGIPNWNHTADLEEVRIRGLSDELPVKVIFVPKTSTTPRVIAAEPSHMMYMQQFMMRTVTTAISKNPLTRKSVNFRNQGFNQDAAKKASIDRASATIDMKDASDRVHYELAHRVFRYTPWWHQLDAARSRSALLPDGTRIELSKFASQGAATCFPVEAYVFYCLIIAAIHIHLRRQPTFDSVRALSNRVLVYGDDIVIPSKYVGCVCSYLESYGLVVNRHKSFSVSHFRESCGADYYKGISVKPIYFRQLIPESKRDWTPKQISAAVSTSNQLYEAGYWKTSQLLRTWVERVVGPVPRAMTTDLSGIMFRSYCFNTKLRWSKDYQRFGWKVRNFFPKKVADPVVTMSGALLKALPNIGAETGADYESSTRRGVLTLKHQWISLR